MKQASEGIGTNTGLIETGVIETAVIETAVIETERLRLRPHRAADWVASMALWGDESVTRYIGGRPQTPEECWQRLLRYAGHWTLLGFGYWAVEEKETGCFLGDVGLSDFRRTLPADLGFSTAPEVGWVLTPACHGRGYATEAVRAALAWGERHLGAQRFVCMIHPDNHASARVAEKTGFTPYARAEYHGAPAVLYERLSR
ncbi:GNAT family N-acetyltransferase [Pedomonas sp. V897]|uniref:GNAT family N-acetyltransferase n=1 Tax=Pedomonas sp. V897 TaxID=3446482 RepID=UPI003EE3747D